MALECCIKSGAWRASSAELALEVEERVGEALMMSEIFRWLRVWLMSSDDAC
jgi:hypothetical protein